MDMFQLILAALSGGGLVKLVDIAVSRLLPTADARLNAQEQLIQNLLMAVDAMQKDGEERDRKVEAIEAKYDAERDARHKAEDLVAELRRTVADLKALNDQLQEKVRKLERLIQGRNE